MNIKKILLFILLFGISPLIYSQTIIGNAKRGPILIAELSLNKKDSSDVYKLRYLDATTSILKSLELNVSQNKIEELYTFFSKMVLEANGTSEDFSIGNVKINATTQKMMGLRNILITINESSNFGLNLKEINKLFGR